MKKIAIFTEGQTEQLFVAEVIKFIAAENSFYITKKKLYGGKRFPTITLSIDDEGDSENCEYYFLLIDCGTDGRVVSEINERYAGLIESGYDAIIGMRDLAPSFRRDQLDKLFDTSKKYLSKEPLEPLLVIAVMEVEAWFIAENTHFLRLDARLTREKIVAETAIDIDADASAIDRPSLTLPEIYKIAQLPYGKSRADIENTLQAISMEEYRDDSALLRAASVKPLFDKLRSIFGELDRDAPAA